LEALTAAAAHDGWTAVPNTVLPEDYSSLLGLPVVGRPQFTELAFGLESTYYTTDCHPMVQLPFAQNWTQAIIDRLSQAMQFNFMRTAVQGRFPGSVWGGTGPQSVMPRSLITYFIDMPYALAMPRELAFYGYEKEGAAAMLPHLTDNITVPNRLVFGSLYRRSKRGEWRINLTNCTLFQTHVESQVHCLASGGCRIARMRRSRCDRRPQAVTPLDNLYVRSRVVTNLPIVYGSLTPASKPAELFLDGSDALGFRNVSTAFVDLSHVPARTFSKRLSIVLTTFYEQLMSQATYSGGLPAELARYHVVAAPAEDLRSLVSSDGDSFVVRTAPSQPLDTLRYKAFHRQLAERVQRELNGSTLQAITIATSATVTQRREVYACRFGWLAMLLLVVGTLGTLGAAALLLAARCTLTSDMLRFVASMPYAPATHFSTPP
jgi:hypothetical protein